MSTIATLDSFYLPVVVFAFSTAFFLVLLWSMLRRPRDRVTAFEDGNGKVTVSRRALEDIIARSCEQFDEIVRAKVSVRTRNDKIRTEIQLRLKQSARVRDFSKQLRARITDILTDNLGMEDVGTMEFIVAGIVAEKPPLKRPTWNTKPRPKKRNRVRFDQAPGAHRARACELSADMRLRTSCRQYSDRSLRGKRRGHPNLSCVKMGQTLPVGFVILFERLFRRGISDELVAR